MPGQDSTWVGRMPEIYHRHLGPAVFAPFAADTARRAARLGPGRVLELAAGTGIATRELVAALPAAALVATDLNPAMTAWGARTVPQASWAVADAQRPPFRDRAFDLVVCQFGVMFLPDRPAAFAQARRLLAPGGRVLFTTWAAVDTHGFGRALGAGLRRAFPDDPPTFLARVPHGYHDLDRIEADVRAGGLTGVEIDTVTRTGRGSADDIATGFCTGSPLRPEIERRGDLAAAVATVRQALAAELGPDPVTAEMTAHVVTAR